MSNLACREHTGPEATCTRDKLATGYDNCSAAVLFENHRSWVRHLLLQLKRLSAGCMSPSFSIYLPVISSILTGYGILVVCFPSSIISELTGSTLLHWMRYQNPSGPGIYPDTTIGVTSAHSCEIRESRGAGFRAVSESGRIEPYIQQNR